MRLITLIVCSLYSLGVFGSLVGGGNLTLGASKDQDADKIWGERQGACGYLTKPVDDKTLISAVNGLLTE